MSENGLPNVEALIRRLDRIERDTEVLYLDLGTIFPAIKSAIDESARQSEQGIRAILTGYQHGASAEQAKRRSEEFIRESSVFFEKLSAKEKTFLNMVESNISELSRLDDIINRVRLDSEEMELVSLNAMTVALKSGHAGKAFSVITDELKRLSSRTILHANELSLVGSDLLMYLAQLREELAALERDRIALFQEITRALNTGFGNLDRQIHDTAEGFRQLAASAASVREPVAQIMQGVQVQDIIRQSLDHVRLSLKVVLEDERLNGGAQPDNAAIAAARPALDDEKAFLAEITRLSAVLLEDIQGQVRGSLDSFEQSIGDIDRLVQRVGSDQQQLLASHEDTVATGTMQGLAEAYLRGKHRVNQTAQHVAEGVKRLDDRFAKVQTILSRFNNIVIASRIEIARNKALGLVANTVLGMMDLTQRLGEDVASAGMLTRSFSKSVNSEVFAYLGAGDMSEHHEFEDAMEQLKLELDHLAVSGRNLLDATKDFEPFAGAFFVAIGKAREQTGKIRLLAEELAEMQWNLTDSAIQLEKDLGISMQDTLAGKLVLRNQRLREIVDRFTIFTHRQTANRIAQLGDGQFVDEAAASGDVTLF